MTCLGNTHRGHTATKQNISKMKIETNEENHNPGEENSRRKWHHTGGEGYQVEISHILAQPFQQRLYKMSDIYVHLYYT